MQPHSKFKELESGHLLNNEVADVDFGTILELGSRDFDVCRHVTISRNRYELIVLEDRDRLALHIESAIN